MQMHHAYLRHAQYYARRLAELGQAYKDRMQSIQALSEFTLEWPQIESGQLRAVENKTTSGRQCCSDYGKVAASLLSLRQSANDRIRWLTNALEAAIDLKDIHAEATHLGNLGIAYEDLGQFELSRDCLRQAIDLDMRCEDVCSEQVHAGQLGLACIGLGNYEDAQKYLNQALALAVSQNNLPAQSIHLGNLGLLYGEIGDYPRAIEMHKEALGISQAVGDRRGEGRDIGNLGVIYFQIGQYSEAETFFRQSLAVSRELGDRYGEALDLSNLTGLYEVLGQDERALQYGEEALTVCSAIGAVEREGATLTSLGIIAQRLQMFDIAEALIRRAIEMSDSTRNLRSKASRLRALAETELHAGNWARATESGQQAVDIAQRIGTKDIEAEASITLAAIFNGMGHRAEAAHHAGRAIEIGRELGAPQIEKAARDELERAHAEVAVRPNEPLASITRPARRDLEVDQFYKLRRRLRDLFLGYEKR